MIILVVILHVIVCLVLIAVILLQAGRGQGLTGASFGGNVQSLFGTKGSVFLQKATSASAICFMVTCITLSIFETQRSKSLLEVGRKPAPIDIDQIQKALEKVKSEAKQQTASQQPGTAVPAEAQTSNAVQAAAAPAQAAAAAAGGEMAASQNAVDEQKNGNSGASQPQLASK